MYKKDKTSRLRFRNRKQRQTKMERGLIMAYSRKDDEKTKQNVKKFVRYQEGAEKYSMGLTKFTALAKEAKAVYKIDKVTLVNCEIFERYLESFRIP